MIQPREILRIIDAVHRDRDIDKEVLFLAIEQALTTAARKQYGQDADINVLVDREDGRISVTGTDGENIQPEELGRISAQTAKQVIIQKFREAERDVIYDQFVTVEGEIANGTIARMERGNIIVNLGKTEGIIPRREQVPSEVYRVGERIKAIVTEVKKVQQKIRIVVSRSSPELVKRLFEIEVPEIAEKIIEIRGIAREPGYRTKIVVYTADNRIDAVGACVGVRGSRIKNIIDELNGEKIDIVKWAERTEDLIENALRPARISSVEIDEEKRHAVVLVPGDQLNLAIGRKGQNVRLASKLVDLEIDVTVTPDTSKAGQEKFATLFGGDTADAPEDGAFHAVPGDEEKGLSRRAAASQLFGEQSPSDEILPSNADGEPSVDGGGLTAAGDIEDAEKT